MLILARSEKGKEFIYSRVNIVRVPSSWSKRVIELTIDGLNRYFNLSENETYAAHRIDQYDNIYPAFTATIRDGKIAIKKF